jgi:cytoskeletal protein CcmA (bactofilin family)
MWPFRDPKTLIPTFDVANTIGAGSRVRGDLSGPGGFRIDGMVEGGIDADGPIVIGEGGTVEGVVRGRNVVVLGRVRGDVHVAGHLEIGPNGKVVGDITVKSFRMHTGGVFRGTSCMPGGEDAAPALLFGVASTTTSALETRVRTLPPPNGAVVPPPPALAELAEQATRSSDVPDEAVSQQRLISTADSDSPPRRAVG